MDLTALTHEQKEALLDLLILGMYADHKLASAEDSRIQQILDNLQSESEYERQRISDAAFTRVSRHTSSPDAMCTYVKQLALHFPTPEIRRKACESLNELLSSDNSVS